MYLYGQTEFGKMIGWSQQKMAVYFQRGKLPEPFALVGGEGGRPVWTREQIEWYKGDQGALTVPELKKIGLLPKECQECLDSPDDDWHCPRTKRIEGCPRREVEGD
jgi:hypothetical protein